MSGDVNGFARAWAGLTILLGLALALGGCGSGGGLGGTDLLGSFSSADASNKAAGADGDLAAAANDTPCPEMQIRTGASTLIVSSKPGEGTPNPLDVRYQGSIVRLARECRLNAGLLTIKVGVEGRVVTGPAGTPGTVNVPLRIAVVEDAVRPKTIVSRFASIPVTVNSAVDRVTFTHVDPDVSFPAPSPLRRVDFYVIYVGFDPMGNQQQRAPRRNRRATSRART